MTETSSKVQVASDMMTIDDDRSDPSFLQNLQAASIETGVIFGLFIVVVGARAITDSKILEVFKQLDLWIWVVVFLFINAFLKTFYPKFDDQLINASIFSIVYTLMIPLKIEQQLAKH